MHIGINAQLLSFSQSYRNGGVSRYIRYLLHGLAAWPGEHEYSVFVNGEELVSQLPVHEQIHYISAPWSESRPTARIAWEQITLPSLLKQKMIDVLHSPVNVLPERLPSTCAGVVTLHDLAFLRFPEVLTRPKRIYHQTFTVRSLKRASALITVSESTKQDAIELVGIPASRISAVPICIDPRFSRVESVAGEKELIDFREKHVVGDGFILYLGTLEPRKNITTLLDAYALLRQRYELKEKLVLAGGKGWLYDEIFAKVQQLGLEQVVIFPGYVSDADQLNWYRSASVFAFPSLYEGFGLPVAEALACGTPVVTSNISSLPEAGAGIALCIDPHNQDEMAEALYKSLTDKAIRQRSQDHAAEVADRFSIARMVEQTRTVYERAAGDLISHNIATLKTGQH